MKQPLYCLERWTHGWVLAGPNGTPGIPLDAMNEVLPLFPEDAFLAAGIASHLVKSGASPGCAVVIVTAADAVLWEQEIAASLAGLDREQQWRLGTDIGLSSLAIFAVMRGDPPDPRRDSHTPRDAEDLGRCLRLLIRLPEWRGRLPEVAAAYPGGHWPAILARWEELEAAAPESRTAILKAIHMEGGTP